MEKAYWDGWVPLALCHLPIIDHYPSANALFKRWKVAEKEAKESERYFRDLCESVGAEKTKLWTVLEEQMQIQREDDIKVMDQLDVKDRKGAKIDGSLG